MYEEYFPERLAQLRIKKDVSARDMSLSLGQNPSYIHNIESGKALPSMRNFFYICEYLNISPCEFFDPASENPEKLHALINDLKQLNDAEMETITALVGHLLKNH